LNAEWLWKLMKKITFRKAAFLDGLWQMIVTSLFFKLENGTGFFLRNGK
jgi:hypothetical protein